MVQLLAAIDCESNQILRMPAGLGVGQRPLLGMVEGHALWSVWRSGKEPKSRLRWDDGKMEEIYSTSSSNRSLVRMEVISIYSLDDLESRVDRELVE